MANEPEHKTYGFLVNENLQLLFRERLSGLVNTGELLCKLLGMKTWLLIDEQSREN